MLYKIYTWLNAGVCLVIAALLILVFSYHMDDSNIKNVDMDYSAGWNYSDGTDADLMELVRTDGEHILEKYISSEESDGASLCFLTRNLFFTVSLGDEVIYDFRPELTGIMGKYYGDYIHYVYLPSFRGTEKLSIRYTSLLDAGGTVFQDMRLQTSRNYEHDILARNYSKFFISSTIVALGVLLVLFGMVIDTDAKQKAETTALGAFAVVLGVWTNSGTLIIQVIGNDSVYTRLLDYASLMLMPVPVMIFSASSFGFLDSKIFKASVILPIVNFIFSFGVSFLGITDYHDILFLTHIVILISMVFLGIMYANRKKHIAGDDENSSLTLPIKAAFIILLASGIIDMIRYYTAGSMDTAQFSRIGLAISAVVLTMHEFRQLFNLTRKEAELRMMEKLAHTDGLTKLGNRNAFERLESDLRGRTEGSCVFVQFDINDLKLVNDKYGHAEGDRHISKAADIIGSAFPGAKCFRMGGDEFLAVVLGDGCERRAMNGIDSMNEMQRNYNSTEHPHVPLAIAYGWAVCDLSGGDPESAEKEADMKMYECKVNMKGGRVRC